MHNEGIAGGKKFDSSRRDTTILHFALCIMHFQRISYGYFF